MKHIVFIFLLLFIVVTSCNDVDMTEPAKTCSPGVDAFNYSKADQLQAIADKYTKLGVPGIGIAVKTSEGEWAGASGYAKIENQTLLQACHTLYGQSVSKSYTAVLVMMLYEEGKIDLNKTIDQYLPEPISSNIKGSNTITVQHLLSHTSGIPDYIDVKYLTEALNNQDKIYPVEHYLSFVYDKDLKFTPGSRYEYANINFLLLALMVDEVTGKDHSIMMAERIFQPLGLSHSYYKNEPNYLHHPELVNVYFDRRGISKLENVSQAQINIHTPLIGDDGVVATSLDFVRFLHALVHTQLVKPETLDLMKTWVKDDEGELAYGLGLAHTSRKGIDGFGHSGGGFGSGCILYHFPEKDITLFIGINIGTFFESPISARLDDMIDEVMEVL